MFYTLQQKIFGGNLLKKRISLLERRLRATTHCFEQISSGNFNISIPEQEAHDEEGKSFIDTFTRMKSKLIEYREREKERAWVAEGMEKCMHLLSGDNRMHKDFYDRILAFLVKYSGSNQGGIFILNDHKPEDPFLDLTACYAYDKKKCADKRIAVGQGMLGQCFLEKKITIVTRVPQYYVSITSGLGEATPDFLLMVPIQVNGQSLGVLELASFGELEPFLNS
jgi:methyl-accepting chemotaxis protein